MRDASKTFTVINMPDFNFKIKTEADLKALEATKSGLEESRKATAALGKDTSALEAEIRKVDAALQSEAANAVRSAEGLKKAIDATKQAKGDSKPLESQLRDLEKEFGLGGKNPLSKAAGFLTDSASKLPGAETFQKIFNGTSATVASAGVAFAAAAKGINEYAEAQANVTDRDAALARTGQLTDANREKLADLAATQQAATGVADDFWEKATARIIQFGGTVDEIEKHTKAVENYAGILDGDVLGAVEGVSRALEGNFMAFTRLGFQYDEHASRAQNLEKLYAFLAEKGVGLLAARSQTLHGQWQQLKNSSSDLFEALGRGIAKTRVLQSVLYGLTSTAAYLAQSFGGAVPQIDGMKNALQRVGPTAAEAEKSLKRYGDEVKDQIALSKAYEDSLEREIDAIRRKQRAQDEITDAKTAVKLAAVDTLEKDGKISQAQAIQQRADINAKAKQAKAQSAVDANQEIIDAKEADKEAKAQEVYEASQAVSEAEAAQAKLDARNKALKNAKAPRGESPEYWKSQLEALGDYEEGKGSTLSLSLPDLDMEFSKVTGGSNEPDRLATARRALEGKLYRAERDQKMRLGRAEDVTPVTDEDKATAAQLGARKERYDDLLGEYPEKVNKLQTDIDGLRADSEQVWKRMGIEAPGDRLKTANDRQEAQKKAVAEPFPKDVPVTDAVARLQQQIAGMNVAVSHMLDKIAAGVQKTGEANLEGLRKVQAAQDAVDAKLKAQEKQIGDLQTKVKHRD